MEILPLFACCLCLPFLVWSAPLSTERGLLQTFDTLAAIRVADFSSLPENMDDYAAFDNYTFPEVTLTTKLSVSSCEASLGGVLKLTSEEAFNLNAAVTQEMPEILPADSATTLLSNDPAMFFNGTSWEESSGESKSVRIPTVWSPTRSGRVFTFPAKRAYFFNIRNVTLLDGETTWSNFHASSLFDYVPLIAAGGLICFSNSIFVLQSCDGFPSNKVHSLCCSMAACITRTVDELTEFGFAVPPSMALLECYSTTASSDDSYSKVLFASIATAAIAVPIALIAALAAIIIIQRRNRRQIAQHAALEGPLGTDKNALQTNPPFPHRDETHSLQVVMRSQSEEERMHLSLVEPMQRLECALESMRTHKVLFMGRYEVLGAVHRRLGGQGVVQFAQQDGRPDQVAIKFFMDAATYSRELEQYNNKALEGVLPPLEDTAANTGGASVAPDGFVFPPAIITQRGESLNEFAARVAHEPITVIQALVLIVKRVQQLHSTDMVHRDLKPANILRMPQMHSWVLIDFGCAAPAGTVTWLAYSPAYAAPEVIAAVEAGKGVVEVQQASDIWSVGIIAYELLTGKVAFPTGTLKAEIHAAALGRIPLPWEEDGNAELKKLMRLRGPVLQCLDRDPARRPTAAQLAAALDAIFRDVTTIDENSKYAMMPGWR